MFSVNMKKKYFKNNIFGNFSSIFWEEKKKRKEKGKKSSFFLPQSYDQPGVKKQMENFGKKEEQNGSDDFRQIKVCKNLIGEKLTVRTVTNHKASTVVLPIGPYLYTIFLLQLYVLGFFTRLKEQFINL